MTNKEIRKLRRSDLLEMLIELEQENKMLAEENETLLKKVEERKIAIANAGSIAEAALQLNRIFDAAQSAADQYLDNIRVKSEQAKVTEEQEWRNKENEDSAE